MEEKKNEKKVSIWRDVHTPLNQRTTSSGITFRTERVVDEECCCKDENCMDEK